MLTVKMIFQTMQPETFLKPHPAGAQSSRGSLVQPVIGVYFLTDFFDTLTIGLESVSGPNILSVFEVDDQPADLSRPLLALGGCRVSGCVWLAPLFHLGIHIEQKY